MREKAEKAGSGKRKRQKTNLAQRRKDAEKGKGDEGKNTLERMNVGTLKAR